MKSLFLSDMKSSPWLVLLGLAVAAQMLSCSGCKDDDIFGCTDPEASNYSPVATVDDGTCIEPIAEPMSTIELGFGIEWDGEPFTIGTSGLDAEGRAVQLERFECYVSDFAILDSEEGWIDIDTVARIDFSQANPFATLTLAGDRDRTISAIRMGLGVPADRNLDVDPASYENPDHPLGFKGSAGMHWGWAAGYIFSVYEGRLLTDPELPFAYHAGEDTCFRTVELQWNEPWILPFDGVATPSIVVDAYKCLHGANDVIDVPTDPETHTGNNLPLALRWVDLYQQAWRANP